MEFKEIKLPFKVRRPVLALGSDIKNTVCFAGGNAAFVSEVIGDLKLPAAFKLFEKTVKSIPRRFRTRPRLIACDLHPEYFSSKYASALFPSCNIQRIQHHHAHICSCMAENGLPDKGVIGIAFDGTGYGDDSTFWGAEFLICDYSSFQRLACLKPVPLAGGDKAVLEPWRLLFARLYSIYKNDMDSRGIGLFKGIDKRSIKVVKGMIDSGYNSPLSSSMGRLFDAVGALVLKKYKVRDEAEAAIALQASVPDAVSFALRPYRFNVVKKDGKMLLDPALMFGEILADLREKKAPGVISYRFHLTVAAMAQKICLLLRKETGINKIVFSGGVFQNKILLGIARELLYNEKFEVFIHNKLPCSDAGISLGQAVIAAQIKDANIHNRKS
ncbi:MAG: hypothetical protein PHJ00_06750 [Candidatus Omnitrophica bacterium]|nr:hypothetical protein [Candidatus Omnitrophota bacterium]